MDKEITDEKKLLQEIYAFCARHDGMKLTAFGRKAMGNPNFVSDIEKGTSPTYKTGRKVRTWMKNEDTKRERRDAAGS